MTTPTGEIGAIKCIAAQEFQCRTGMGPLGPVEQRIWAWGRYDRQHAGGIWPPLQDDEAYDARSDDGRPGRCPPARERHKGSSCNRHR
jgi:hypothetical protein